MNELYNKRKRKEYHNRKNKKCLNCGKETTNKFCEGTCQHIFRREEKFKKIESGDLSFGIRTIKLYFIDRYGEKCMDCGWNEVNKYSGNIPIEIEHIDGNSENNTLNNLKLLCPNCHSLTPTYKALNIGNGRHSRRQRYKDNKSF
jgi:hypothetical protein